MRSRHVQVARGRSLGDGLAATGNPASRGMLAGPPLTLVVCVVAIALVAGACTGAGGSSRHLPAATTATTATMATASRPASTTEGPAVAATVNVTLADYAIRVARNPVRANHLTFRVVNHDGVPHNLTLIATRRAPDRLPTSGIRVDVSNPAIRVVAATPWLRPSGSGRLTATLHRGRYILVCTVPHHYVRSRMVATVTVG
jgi:uncharacterized cupredoxin-like copper-binding protein